MPDDPCTLHIPAFGLPFSSLLDAPTREVLARQAQEIAALHERCPITATTLSDAREIIAFRQCYDRHYLPRLAARQKSRYEAAIEPETIAGVSTEVFTSSKGISTANRRRVLINLHGGSFLIGARWVGQIESLPIAAVGQIKVVSVDYRMGPEHRFPAASEDVGRVYQALLKQYEPESIGIYGCSAGAVLTAQTVAWLQNEGLPGPGAAGMLCAAASFWGEGDSGRFHSARSGLPLAQVADPRENPYFRQTDPNDSLAFPLRSAERMARFPPSLLISAMRDQALSSVVHTHSRLVEFGVEAELHVWEGLDHAFHYIPELPQSQRVYEVVAQFFARHLV